MAWAPCMAAPSHRIQHADGRCTARPLQAKGDAVVEMWEIQDVADRIVLQVPSLQAVVGQLNEAGKWSWVCGGRNRGHWLGEVGRRGSCKMLENVPGCVC